MKNAAACLTLFIVFSGPFVRAQAPVGKSRSPAPSPMLAEGVVFGGGAFGSGGHALVGGGVGIEPSRRWMGTFELAYVPLGSAIIVGASLFRNFQLSDSRLLDINAGVHLQFPNRSAVRPYLAFSAGLLHGSFVSTNVRFGQTFQRDVSQTDFAFGAGGGLRVFITRSFGFRPEIKVFAGDSSFTRVSFGVFFQGR